MVNDEAPSGFLSRWSRRKAEVREGRVPQELVSDAPLTAPVVSPVATASSRVTQGLTDASDQLTKPEVKPVPTLADAQQLTPDSDFTGFMTRGVTPDVKNAAMKKLFADPHFNVMDRMDIYIDDYSQPDPLPLTMLRQMASAKTLNLFDDDPVEPIPPQVALAQTNTSTETAPLSVPTEAVKANPS